MIKTKPPSSTPEAAQIADLNLIIEMQQDIATACLPRQAMMDYICNKAQVLCGATAAFVELLEGGDIVCCATSEAAAAQLGVKTAISASLSGSCLQTGEALHYQDIKREGRGEAHCLGQAIASMIAVPLAHNQTIIGVLRIVSEKPASFSERDIKVLKLMGGLLSASISRAAEVEARSSALASLQESEARFRKLIDTAYEAILISRNGIVLEANAAFCRMFGYDLSELEGRPILDFLAPEERALTSQKIRLEDDPPYESVGLRKDGSTFAMEGVEKSTVNQGQVTRITALRDISRRKNAEEALRASEMKFRSVLTSASDAVIAADAEGMIVAWNPAAERIFGYDEKEALGKSLTMIMPARFHARHTQGMAAVKQAGRLRQDNQVIELVGLRKDGSEFPIDVSLSVWHDGKDLNFASVIRDISDKKLAENELKQTTKRLQTLIDLSPVGIFVLDLDLNLSLWNSSCEVMFGWTAAEVLGKRIGFISIDRWSDFDDLVTAMVYKQERCELKTEGRRSDGSHIMLHISAIPLLGVNGEIYSYLATAIDISAQARNEIEIREAREQAERDKAFSESITSLVPNHIYIYDINQKAYAYTNKEIASHLSYTPEQINAAGPNFLERVLHPEDLKQAVERLQEFSNKKDKEIIEFIQRLRHADGGWRWMIVRETVFRRALDGRVTQIIGAMQDITELKLREGEITAANKALATATRTKSEFLANMSHEIRTPINGVIGMTSLLLGLDLSAEQKEYVDAISVSANTLLVLINDILDFSKVEAGKIELEIVNFDLEKLLTDVERTLEFAASKKGLTITHSLQRGLPRFLKGDPTRLQQIVLNLVNNAIKFTAQGSVAVSVSCETMHEDNLILRFEVTDTGVGISEEALSRMFQAFSQADASTTRLYGGTGLGLSICKHLVGLMGGKIGVETTEGRGSTFWFTVHLHPGSTPALPEKPICYPSRLGVPLQILVAEDNVINQAIAIKTLEKLGHNAVAVANGAEAIDALEGQPYDLILMDCQMPEMDGYQATELIRKKSDLRCRQVPIIAMTAFAMKEDRDKCLQVGMDDYVSKPVKLEDLQSVIEKVMLSKKQVAS